MEDFDISQLEIRLCKLERKNLRLKKGVLASVLSVLVLLIIGAASPEPVKELKDLSLRTLHVRKVVISDHDGRERMVLQLESNEPSIKMFNHRGQRQVFLGIDELWDDAAYLSVSSRLDVDETGQIVGM